MNRTSSYGMIITRDVPVGFYIHGHQISLFPGDPGARDHKEVRRDMNKYELAVVVSAKIEDDARAATVIEKVKALVSRFGGTVTDVDEWGKRRFAYEIQKMKEGYYYFIHFESDAVLFLQKWNRRIRIMENVTQIFMR